VNARRLTKRDAEQLGALLDGDGSGLRRQLAVLLGQGCTPREHAELAARLERLRDPWELAALAIEVRDVDAVLEALRAWTDSDSARS